MDGIATERGRAPGAHVWVALCLALAMVYFIYMPILGGPFTFDDFPNIRDNETIRSLDRIPRMFTHPDGYLSSRPIALASFALNHRLGGYDPAGYRAVNMLLHALAGFLLYALVLRTAGRMEMAEGRGGGIALSSALLFVAHPLQTESVAYIVTRSMLLAGVFFFLGLLVFDRAAEAKGKLGRAGAAAALTAISLMGMASREDYATFPAILLLYDYTFVARYRWREVAVRWWLHGLVWLTLGYAAYLSLGFASMGGHTHGALGPGEYLITQVRAHMTYLRLILLPMGQTMDYDYPLGMGTLGPEWAASLLGYCALWAGGAYLLFMRRHWTGFLVLGFMVALTPASSIVPLKDVVFDHRLYIALAGVVVLAVSVIQWGTRARPRLSQVLCAAVLILMALAARERAGVWASNTALWKDVTEKAPMKSRGFGNLAQALMAEGEGAGLSAASAAAVRAVALDPSSSRALGTLGEVLQARGLGEEALGMYLRAANLDPADYSAHYHIGLLSTKMGRYDLAVFHYSILLKLKPLSVEGYNNLGLALVLAGRPEEAVEPLLRALAPAPAFSSAQYNLAIAYSELGEYAEARKYLMRYLSARPDDLDAVLMAGDAARALGRPDEAEAWYRAALALGPGNATALDALRALGRPPSP